MNDKKIDKRNKLNELNGTEWIKFTSTIIHQRGLGRGHPDTKYETMHPAPFSYTIISEIIKFFTKNNQSVLDPFCGIGSVLKACEVTNRIGTGIELYKKWVDLTNERLISETSNDHRQNIIHGDNRQILITMEDSSFDFIITSPPYWSILNKKIDHKQKKRVEIGLDTDYGDNKNDFGNIKNYSDFIDELSIVFSECYRVLKNKKYMVVIVSDFRHGKEYVDFHSDIIKIMKDIGFISKGIKILIKSQKPLHPYGYPFDFVPSIQHEYILIFRKDENES